MNLSILRKLIMLSVLCLISCTEPITYDLTITNVGLFNGEEDVGIVNIGINADSIAIITKDEINSENTIDGTGKYIIPGMVNAHVHAASVEELKEGYLYGILANLNMHTGLEDRERNWKEMTRDSIGFPTLYGSGHAATVPGGHPNQFSPNMETINDSLSIEQWVDNRIANGADYIKIVRDNHGWLNSPPIPTLSFEQIGQIISYSKSKGYKTVVHAITIGDMLKIAKYKPDGFVHMMERIKELPISDEDFNALSESNVFVIPNALFAMKSRDSLPPFIRDWLNEHVFNKEQSAAHIKRMHDAGISIVAGTDAQTGLVNFGDDFYKELEMYQLAGLSNLEVLQTATGNAAKAFDIPIGLLKEGSKVNMLLLNGNPIDDLWDIKNIERIWKY